MINRQLTCRLQHRAIIISIALLLLAACTPATPAPTPTPAPTGTPPPTPSPTATILWFPPTETPTLPAPPEPSPTAFPLPVFAELLLHDDFTDGSTWSLSQTPSGSTALGVSELSVVVNEPGGYVSTTRVDEYFTDFFLEVTAATSLCLGLDEYGLILRAASPSDFYRLSFSCNGQMRLDMIRGGTASAPLTWTPSAAVPRSAPATSLIGVWADGDVMHIFIDDGYQLTIPTAQLEGGTIGFFARSAGDNAVTVNFSELYIWEVAE